ncbi:MAG: glycosyltransferase [Cellvibrio sp.]|uniref:MGDG synthase family glycosyltransferase n=1 Tax=Cellvibrio sp. TaxID=1965322 RepID=UPI0031A9E33F
MKCLFLTSSPGYGHTRAAEAIDQSLRFRYPGIETKYLNITSLIDEQVSVAIQDGYLRMTAEQPDLYQKLYDLDKNFYRQLAGKIPADQSLIDFLEEQQRRYFPEVFERSRFSLQSSYKSLDSALFNTLVNGICNRTKIPAGRLLTQGVLGLMYNIMASRLKKFVNEYSPDFIIATQMYPNALLSRSIQKGAITQPVIGVLTDYGVHGVWVRNTTALYCVSHEGAAETLRRQGVSADRIRVTGIPLVAPFANIPTQSLARQQLGLEHRPTVLITGGQCGIGVVDAVKRLLSDEQHDYQILVTAGSNTSDAAALKQLASDYKDRCRLYGWCSDICHLICAADVVVGKPGGLTLSETLACGRPFIATCCLGGQEMHNVQFLQTKKAGLQVDPDQLPDVLGNIFGNPDLLRNMKRNAYQLGRPNAAAAVVAEVENIMRERQAPYIPQVSVAEL